MKASKKNLLFRIFLAALAVTLFIIPDSVTSPEIEQRVIASVLGVDKADGIYKVTAQVVVPKRAGEGDPAQDVVSAEGKSVPEGIDKLNRALGRNIELGHCGVIVIGDTAGADFLDYLLAGSILTTGTYLVNAADASQFIESVKGMSTSTITGLDGYINFSTASANTSTKQLLQFVSETASPSRTSYVPSLEADSGDGGKNGSGESRPASAGGGSGGQSAGGKSSEEGTPTIKSAEKTAIYVDSVKVGVFGEKETRGLAWLDKQATRGYVSLENFEADGQSMGGVYAQLKSKSSRLQPYFKDGRPFVKVRIRANLILNDKHKLHLFATKTGENAAVSAMEEAFEALIREEIGAGMIKATELKADPFGIKTAFYRYSYDRYGSVDGEGFSDVRVEYDVDVKVN